MHFFIFVIYAVKSINIISPTKSKKVNLWKCICRILLKLFLATALLEQLKEHRRQHWGNFHQAICSILNNWCRRCVPWNNSWIIQRVSRSVRFSAVNDIYPITMQTGRCRWPSGAIKFPSRRDVNTLLYIDDRDERPVNGQHARTQPTIVKLTTPA